MRQRGGIGIRARFKIEWSTTLWVRVPPLLPSLGRKVLTLESLNTDKPLYVFLAAQFAERALPIWEKEYPKDMKPRRAIEAAKEWLKNPSNADAYATYAAANAAAADYAANAAAADYATHAAAAAHAAYGAAYAAHAAYDAHAAAYAHAAANNAAKALEADKENLIHEVILESLDWILQYKIENGERFAQPELIFDYLTEEQKQRFLFNLEALR